MLKVIHDTLEEIPEAFRELYTQRDGKYLLTGIAGVKTEADVATLSKSLNSERDEHKATKEKLRLWEGLEPDKVRLQLDRVAELEVAARGNKEEIDKKLEELTEARVRSRIAPVERENTAVKKQLEEATVQLQQLQKEQVRRTVHDNVRAAAEKGKILPEAIVDVLLLADAVFAVAEGGAVLTKDNAFGITPGLSPEVWVQEMQDKRPHWWPRSESGNAKGSGGGGYSNNPFSREHWNMTEQGKIVKEKGKDVAEMMAKAAGVTLGAVVPASAKK